MTISHLANESLFDAKIFNIVPYALTNNHNIQTSLFLEIQSCAKNEALHPFHHLFPKFQIPFQVTTNSKTAFEFMQQKQ